MNKDTQQDELGSPNPRGEFTDQSIPAPAGKAGKKIPVVELFGPTIEGEGAVIGTPTMFIRFGLCDYKCTKCDSMHAVDPTMVKALANWMTQDEILVAILEKTPKHIKTITFSGGNPAIHNLEHLVDELHSKGFKIVVETQGTKAPKWLHKIDHLVISPKSPGMTNEFDAEVFTGFVHTILLADLLGSINYSIKVVVFTAQDLEFAVGVAGLLESTEIAEWQDHFYLSLGNPHPPVFGIDEESGVVINDSPSTNALVEELLKSYNTLSEEILKDPRLSFAKFLPQLHVLCYGNETER